MLLDAAIWVPNDHSLGPSCQTHIQSKCDGAVMYDFPGGVYKNKLSVF